MRKTDIASSIKSGLVNRIPEPSLPLPSGTSSYAPGGPKTGTTKLLLLLLLLFWGGGGVKKSKAYLLANVLVRQYMKICAFGKVLWNFFYLKISRRRRREYRRIVSIITSMIIRENRIIDQFPTPKHQQIWLPFWKLLAFKAIITARYEAKLLANHSALFSLIINLIILNTPVMHLRGNIKRKLLFQVNYTLQSIT